MSEQHKKNEKNFLIQGSILAIAGVITKLIGAFYRIPLLNIIGTEGNGYYSVAFSIYSVALMLTSYSLPLAVSKLVSARVAIGEYKNANKIFRGAMTFALLAGGIVSLLVFFGADFIATTIMHLDMSAYALRVLAPCILIVALLGVLRGFFQGMGSMIPTAISQVIEQIINAVVSIAGAYLLFNAGRAVGKPCCFRKFCGNAFLFHFLEPGWSAYWALRQGSWAKCTGRGYAWKCSGGL